MGAATVHRAWDALQHRLSQMPPARLAALCGAWMVVSVGISPTLNIFSWVGAARSFPHPYDGTYVESSPVGTGLAHLSGADKNTQTFSALHLGFVVVAVSIMVFAVGRRFGADASRLAVACLFASPLANVLLTWLGQPDPIVFGAVALVAVVVSTPAIVATVAFAVMTHEEVALMSVAAVAVVRSALGDLDRRQAIAMASGGAIGAIVLAAFKAHYGIVASRIGFAEDVGLMRFASNAARTWQTVGFASLGATWIAVFLLGRELQARQKRVLAGVLVALFLVSLLTLDTTRVIALMAMPTVIVLVGYSAMTLSKPVLDRVLAIVVTAGVLFPHVIVYNGGVYVGSLGRMMHWFTS